MAPEDTHGIYGDDGWANPAAQVTFPLSPRRALFVYGNEFPPGISLLPKGYVDTLNRGRAFHADRFLFAHIKDQKPRITMSPSRELPALGERFKMQRPRF